MCSCVGLLSRVKVASGRVAVVLLLYAMPTLVLANGAIDSTVTSDNLRDTICKSGYTKSIRPPVALTNRIKIRMLRKAGIDESHISEYELDHVIPLALGGHPTELANLQLQLWEGANGAKRKDRIEVKLQCLVCSGQVTLDQARREIAEDWEAAYHHFSFVKCHRRKK